MKPLIASSRMLTWLCVLPADKTSSSKQKVLHTIFLAIVFFGNVCTLISSTMFFMKYVSLDLEESLYSLFQIFGGASMIYLITATFFLRPEIKILFEDLSEIYRTYENEPSFQYLVEVNNRSEWIWKIYNKFVIFAMCSGTLAVAVALTLYSLAMHDGDFNSSNVYHPVKLILPRDVECVSGYFGEIIFYLFMAESYLIPNGVIIHLFISICWQHEAFYKMFQHFVGNLRDKNQNDKRTIDNLIRYHMMIKDWFLNSIDVFSPVVLIQLICSVIFLACAVFQLDLEMKHFDINVVPISLSISVSISNLFLYCYFGKMASGAFEDMSDCLYFANWQDLSNQQMKHFIVMIANTQKPIYYHGFKVAALQLETFCDLLRKVFAYYMMFKTLTAIE